MAGKLTQRVERLEAGVRGSGMLRVLQVPQDLRGEELARWKADALVGVPPAALVVTVPLRGAQAP